MTLYCIVSCYLAMFSLSVFSLAEQAVAKERLDRSRLVGAGNESSLPVT